MEKEEIEQQWVKEEEEELEEGLQARRKTLNQETQLTATINGDAGIITSNGNGSGNFSSNNGHGDEEEEEEEGLEDSTQENGVKIKEDEKQRSSEYCVYYDTDKGIWKCRICAWDSEGRTCLTGYTQNPKQQPHMLVNVKTVDQQRPCFIHETKGTQFHRETFLVEENSVESSAPKNSVKDHSDDTRQNRIDGNGLNLVISNHNGEHQNCPNFSDSSLKSSVTVCEEIDNSFKSGINEIESEDIDGVTEFDVETVLSKQETHDLYCPNCNSCITKRVILRKRKRRIRTPVEDAKLNKPETLVPSEIDVVSVEAKNERSHSGLGISLDDNPSFASNEYDHQREPDVFRCLSCFSIFMPAGNGFKLFRMFGEKSDKKKAEGSEQAGVKKGWFSSIFVSDKMEVLSDQGACHSLDWKSNVAGAPILSSTDEPRAQASSSQASSHTTDHKADMENKHQASHAQSLDLNEPKAHGFSSEISHLPPPAPSLSGDNNSPSPTRGPTVIKKPVADESDDAIRKSNRETAMDLPQMDTQHPETPSVKPPFDNGESAENAITSTQLDGLKLLVSSDVGSLIVQNSQMNQTVNITVQSRSSESDEKGPISLFSPSSTVPGESNLGGKMNDPAYVPSKEEHSFKAAVLANSAIIGTENPMDKDTVQEISQPHIIRNRVEIHIEEPLRADKDAVATPIQDVLLHQDKPVNLSKDLKELPAEGTTGKDAKITLSEAPQRSQTILGAPGTAALQHIQSGNHTAESGCTTATQGHGLDVIKSIVYGGLVESITSLSVVSSAAGADAATMNVLALGVANIFGGLFVIAHDLWELKTESGREASDEVVEQPDRYQRLLGRRADFPLHLTVALLSYLIFGLVPPVVYGFSFRKSNDRDLKLAMVAAASIICIGTLAAGKAYVQRPPKSYFKTIVYYVIMGFMVSGVTYVFGHLIMKLLEKIEIFPSGLAVNLAFPGVSSMKPALGSY